MSEDLNYVAILVKQFSVFQWKSSEINKSRTEKLAKSVKITLCALRSVRKFRQLITKTITNGVFIEVGISTGNPYVSGLLYLIRKMFCKYGGMFNN